MSRYRRRWEEPGSSHWEPGYGNGDRSHYYHDDYSRRHYVPSNDHFPRRSFNYWRDETVAPDSYYPRRSYPRESHDERGDGRSRQAPHPRWQRDVERGRDRDDRESGRDRHPPYQSSSRQHHPTPYVPRHTSRARSPPDSTTSPIPRPAPPPAAPRKASPALHKFSEPPPPPSPLKPSPGYLSVSQALSEVVREPGRARKLLVLDLNGTLLFRSPRPRVATSQLRVVQPRPYMQSFRQYLFCADTKAWLDTMVWSSAQPHSVADMVDKVFGQTKGELKAVWNRKSLGLSKEEYHQKTVTTKDLAKPWGMITSASIPSKAEKKPGASSQPRDIHLALSTLLLDDSPHKAALQPYNHVCIPEYDSERRQHDLRSLNATRGSKGEKQNKKAKRRNQTAAATHSSDEMMLDSASPVEKEPYDVTLLAVIGILEAVKRQSNVAGWIRKGGLWATEERRDEDGASGMKQDGPVDSAKDGHAVAPTGNDASSTSDPAMTSEQARLRTRTWFDDASVLAYWVAQGQKALMELGIQVLHGVTE